VVARTVILDSVAKDALDAAVLKWEDAERAWFAIEWTLARDPQIGVPLNEKGDVRAFVYAGAKSIGQPDIDVIYLIELHAIVVRSAVFSEPIAGQAGRA
jgi:hypothetical protein